MASEKTKYPPISPEYKLLFQLVRDVSLECLGIQLEEMFSKVEPVIIDFASKADTNNSQAYFFDSITEISRSKSEIQEWFTSELRRDFKRFSEGLPISSSCSQDEGGSTSRLQIIEEDDLELHLAVVNMATKTHNQTHQDLYQLGQRFAALRGGHQVSELENPIGPTNISAIFHAASNVLDLDKERLLIFYVLFEKTVMLSMASLYDRVNAEFIKADIYPNLWETKASKLEAPEAPETDSSEAGAGSNPAQQNAALAQPVSPKDFQLGAEVFQSILSFLTERRRTDPRFQGHIEFQPDGDRSLLKSKPVVIDAIDKQQQSAQSPAAELGSEKQELNGQVQNPYLLNYAKTKIRQEREGIYRDLDENTIPTADLDTIELVGMLFEEVLNDDDLANITKALICHLHTVYLKVAIVDPHFLQEPEHVARQFLNLAIKAGQDWVDDTRLNQGLYQPLEEIITALMHAFDRDIAVFDQHRIMLQAQIDQVEKRAKLTEGRSREATKGKDRLEYARHRAAAIIDENLACEAIHPVLGDFLYHEWKDCMTMMLLRNPKVESSRDWRSILMVVRSLSKISSHHDDSDSREWLKSIQPILANHIEHALSYLGDDHREHTNDLFALLKKWSSGQADTATLQKKLDYSTKSGLEPESKKTGREALTPEEASILERLKQANLGCWFEFDDADNKKTRVKLSWYSPITHKHMFTDRFGAKAYILPTLVLIRKIGNGSAKIVESEDLAFVDKALIKIHSLLDST